MSNCPLDIIAPQYNTLRTKCPVGGQNAVPGISSCSDGDIKKLDLSGIYLFTSEPIDTVSEDTLRTWDRKEWK